MMLRIAIIAALVAVVAARSCKSKNTCFGHGTCKDLREQNALDQSIPKFKCLCDAGYNGDRCENVVTPQNWIAFNDGCEYLAVYQPVLSWGDAHAACARAGGELAKVLSEDVNEFLGAIQPDGKDEVERWIGLKRDKTGDFSWADKTEFNEHTAYKGWFPTQPGVASEELQCVQQQTVNGVTGWAMAKCKEEQRYICQRCPVTVTKTKKRRRRRKNN
eukprot:m.122252 g.122252  ORF g.122252 m.122252 type:complete len:217 (-) comp13724_c0_seq1:351-1001(-)